jgi:hypothetical protein
MKNLISSLLFVFAFNIFGLFAANTNGVKDRIEQSSSFPKVQIKEKPKPDPYKIQVVDRNKVMEIARQNGLDSALTVLGYPTGACQIGLFDKQLLEELYLMVPKSPPSEIVRTFLNEYYLYPDINKVEFEITYIDFLKKHLKDKSLENSYNYDACLSIMVDIGSNDIQSLINSSFQYWKNLSSNYQIKIRSDDSNSFEYEYHNACENAFLSQYALKQLKSKFYDENEYMFFSNEISKDLQMPIWELAPFESYTLPNYDDFEVTEITFTSKLNSLRDLLEKDSKELFNKFNLTNGPGCDSQTTIFINDNIGYIIDIGNCDEDDCVKCHQYGLIQTITFLKKNKIGLKFYASWS